MKHQATSSFWNEYDSLPVSVKELADKQFELLQTDPRHPSLQFKKVRERGGREIWSARVTLNYRVLAVKSDENFVWFWIGRHGRYDSLLS